jgi:hypothetical protein
MTLAAGDFEGRLDLGDWRGSVLFLLARPRTHSKPAGKADQKDDRDKDDLRHGYFPEVHAQGHDGRILKKKDQEQNGDDNDGYRFGIFHEAFLLFPKSWISSYHLSPRSSTDRTQPW